LVWLKFILSIVIILFAGTKATRYADVIAEKTGLGRIWIGMLLLGMITSMPELITGLSSVTLVSGGIPDLGLGTLLGSCVFNISILAVLDILSRAGPVLNRASIRNITSGSIGILLFAIAAASIVYSEELSGLSFGWVGGPSIIILVIYLICAWCVFRSERNHNLAASSPSFEKIEETADIRWLWPKFILTASAIIAAGIWLSFIGDEIAETTQWDTSFVGSVFLAISTSMPELIVAVSALRLGAVDMAVADIFGANLLDVTYIFLLDLLYTKNPILSSVSGTHAITALVAAVMSLLVILGLRFRQKSKTFGIISWYGPLLIGLYTYAAYSLFTAGLAA